MRDFRELRVWTRAHELALSVYRATATFPQREMYGLATQMRRAGTSIPANIAEGNGRGTDREMARFLHIALGSATELEHYVLLSRDLKYFSRSLYEELAADVTDVKRMLTGFIQKLRADGGRR